MTAALQAIGALTPAANKLPMFTSGSAASLVDAGSTGLDVLAASSEAAGRAALDAEQAGAADDAIADHVADSDPHTQYYKSAGDTLTGTLDANSQSVVNLPTPSSANDAANKAYVDALVSGLDPKASVLVATTAALGSFGAAGGVLTAGGNAAFGPIDGVTLAAGAAVLVKDETGSNAKYNGIYTLTQVGVVGGSGSPWILTRRSDADASAEVTSGMYVYVSLGSTQGANGYVLTTTDPITLDTTSLTFTQFSGAGQIVDGPGLSKSGNTLGVNVDDSTIEINSDALRLKNGGVTANKLADTALKALAGITIAADRLPFFDSTTTADLCVFTSFARTWSAYATAAAAADGLLETTTKGDLAVRTSTKMTRLPVGSNDQVLVADSAQTPGVKWAGVPAGALPAGAPTAYGAVYVPAIPSGKYWFAGQRTGGSLTTRNCTADRLELIRHVQLWSNAWQSITFAVTTAAASGKKGRVVAYFLGSSGLPGAAFWNSPDIAVDSTGDKSTTFATGTGTWLDTTYKSGSNLAPPVGAAIGFAFHTDGAPTIRGVPVGSIDPWYDTDLSGNGQVTSLYTTPSFASGVVTPWSSSGAVEGTSTAIGLALQAA